MKPARKRRSRFHLVYSEVPVIRGDRVPYAGSESVAGWRVVGWDDCRCEILVSRPKRPEEPAAPVQQLSSRAAFDLGYRWRRIKYT